MINDFITLLLDLSPDLLAIIVGSVFIVIADTRLGIRGVQISKGAAYLFYMVGGILLLVGRLTSFTFLFPRFLTNLDTLMTSFKSVSTSTYYVLLSVLFLAILYYGGWRPLVNFHNEKKGYKISAEFVLDMSDDSRGRYDEVGILVENVGRETFFCIAKLESVIFLAGDENPEAIRISEINPNGLFLAWRQGHGSAELRERVPKKVGLLSGNNSYPRFSYENFKDSRSLKPGVYRIGVRFLRKKGDKKVDIGFVEGNVRIDCPYGLDYRFSLDV